jgi:aminopeptidase N
MAHQWWGIGVEPARERDAWLSEGFATFAGLWYMQLILRDNDKYFKHLRDWRKRIRSVRNDAPPVGLGYRMLEGRPEHYDLIVYRKGAWVLHMLRNMMIDFRTMDEEKFIAMMRDFYATHRGGFASTAEFAALVERHFGIPMDWFFEQWVYGTAVPTYVFSWRTDSLPDGRRLLKLRVRQEDAPPGFVMPVPLMIEFDDGGRSFVRVTVRGPLTEGELILPEEPRRLEFNPLESVLAEVKVERWR